MTVTHKCDARRTKIVAECLKNGISRQSAAAAAGISYPTLLRWYRKGEELCDAEEVVGDDLALLEFYLQIVQAESGIETRLVTAWLDSITDDWQAAKEFLSRRFPDRWATKPRGEAEGDKPAEDKALQVHVYLPDNGRGASGQ
jgi:hypothetical protein